ncbi:MAG: HK97 family phage prohead protease [Steroidobacteraceae bacterium]
MNHAYSVLTLKSLDEEARTIEGIATTPSADRVGDVVEPRGAQYQLPMPLLSQHDPERPIGQVTRASVTGSGITITAKLARPYDGAPASWAARLDSAWADIKSGLVRGLSIGFRPIDYEVLPDGSGLRFVKWAWLELSAVTLPCNADANITAVKAAYARHPMPSRDVARRHPAVAAGVKLLSHAEALARTHGVKLINTRG